jgi:hypothetical protein
MLYHNFIACFPVISLLHSLVSGIYSCSYTGMGCESRVGVGSDISTVALRVVEGDEKGTQCLGL